jgi:hypothetical protein
VLILQRIGDTLDKAKANAELQRVRVLASRQELLPVEKKAVCRRRDASDQEYRAGSDPNAEFSHRLPFFRRHADYTDRGPITAPHREAMLPAKADGGPQGLRCI